MLRTSFVIPTKNNASTIARCLSSLMPYCEQYIQDIVVVDGGSTDGTVEIVDGFPVKLLSDPGKGQPLACEIGWHNSTGDLVVFFDGDAYLGDGFFPTVYQYFADERVGIVGCEAQAVVSNMLSRIQNQWWAYGYSVLSKPSGFLQRIHRFVRVQKDEVPPPLGPCQIIRRSCLEHVDGYQGLSSKLPTDFILSKRITNKGWKAAWWLKAPVYHYPYSTLNGLLGQWLRFGREGARLHRAPEFKQLYSMSYRLIYLLGFLASPFLGVTIGIHFRNPWHAVLFPLTRYAFLVGYFTALLRKGKEQTSL